jgi:uncharacterized protein (DUF427 family)
VRLELGGTVIASTKMALRVLETSHPPAIYLPMTAFVPGALVDAEGASYCEFKGMARYHDLLSGATVSAQAGWSYPQPTRGFEALRGYVSIYPGRVDGAWLGEERVQPQEGDFYGGWITAELDGPFKGGAGTRGW